MRGRLAWVALGLAWCLALAACGAPELGPETPGRSSGDSTAQPAPSGASAEGLEPIPADGPGESAALAALPDSLAVARQMRESAGAAWPDLAGAEPMLVAYLVRVTLGGEVALLEVRADGRPHNLYAYQKAFDAASMLWASADGVQGPTAQPRSERERAAVEAVRAAVSDAFPGEQLGVELHGYRFAYVKGGTVPLTLEVDPVGGVISVGD